MNSLGFGSIPLGKGGGGGSGIPPPAPKIPGMPRGGGESHWDIPGFVPERGPGGTRGGHGTLTLSCLGGETGIGGKKSGWGKINRDWGKNRDGGKIGTGRNPSGFPGYSQVLARENRDRFRSESWGFGELSRLEVSLLPPAPKPPQNSLKGSGNGDSSREFRGRGTGIVGI